MHLGDIIKKYRVDNNLSMQAFADKCGLSKGYIAMLERNVNSKTGEPVIPSIETFIKTAKALNMTLSELLELVDENQPIILDDSKELSSVALNERVSNLSTPAAYPIPIIGTICAGHGTLCEDDFNGFFFVDASIRADFCLNVKGDSMTGSQIYDGDKAFIKKTYDYTNGKIYAVRINNDTEAMLKRVYWYADQIVLSPSNPDYDPIVMAPGNVSIIGEFVGVYHPAE